MYKLIAPEGRWMTRGGEYIFSNVVWMSNKEESKKYVLIKEDSTEKITLGKPLEEFLVECQEY